MAVKIFPTVNDVGGGGAGKVITEDNLVKLIKMFLGQNFVLSGFTVPASSTTLNLDVAAGEANIAGYRVVIDTATTVTCTASATNYIYLNLTRDASGNVTGATFTVNTTGTAPADSILIATAVTDASTVTSTTDKRILYPFSYSQLPYTPVNKAGDTMSGNLTLSFDSPKIIFQDALKAAFMTEVDGQLLDFGVNYLQAGIRDATKDGGLFRIDVRSGYPLFNVLYQPAGGTEQVLFCVDKDGQIYQGNKTYKVWHAGNDGAGSGLDADTVDGLHASDLKVPIGTIIWFASSTPPRGFLFCNGAAISRTTYANLFEVIGTTFGAGDNSTTFNLPDLRGVFVRGWDNGRGIDPNRTFGTLQQASYVKQSNGDLLESIANTDPGVGSGRDAAYAAGSGSNFSYILKPVRPVNIALLPCIKY